MKCMLLANYVTLVSLDTILYACKVKRGLSTGILVIENVESRCNCIRQGYSNTLRSFYLGVDAFTLALTGF